MPGALSGACRRASRRRFEASGGGSSPEEPANGGLPLAEMRTSCVSGTGRESDEMLKYRQSAKALAELDLGELDPASLISPD